MNFLRQPVIPSSTRTSSAVEGWDSCVIASILLGAGLMPKRSMIIPTHSTTEKQNSDFGMFTDSLLCRKQSKVSRSSSVALQRCGWDGDIVQLAAHSFLLYSHDAAPDVVGKSRWYRLENEAEAYVL